MEYSLVSKTGMPAWAVPLSFRDEECLYHDHLGRRVLADIDEPGRIDVVANECGAEVIPDQGAWIAVASGPGRFEAVMRIGPEAPPAEADRARGWSRTENPEAWVPDHHLTQICRFSPCAEEDRESVNWSAQNASAVEELDSCFLDGSPHRAPVMSHLNLASWTITLSEPANALIIRKLYDQFHGRQRARALLDGSFAGWWHLPWQSRTCRWAWAECPLPGPIPAGDHILGIDPPSGTPLWSVSEIEVLAV